jgi:arylsulfatase A-like enzyme
MEESRAKNVAFVEHLDDAIGRFLSALDQAGLRDSTLVVFTADNGGSLPHAQSNHPYRDGKQSHYDGGLRVPFMIRWPAMIPAGSRSDYAGLLFDLFPTCVELAGAELPEALDAVSLVPLLRGQSIDAKRDLYFVRREGGLQYGGKSYQALIRGNWKLLQNSPYQPLELYDLAADPLETNDLASSRRPIVNQLSSALRERIRAAGGVPWQPPSVPDSGSTQLPLTPEKR